MGPISFTINQHADMRQEGEEKRRREGRQMGVYYMARTDRQYHLYQLFSAYYQQIND